MLNHPGVRLLAATVLVFGGLWLHELIQALARPPLIVDSALDQSIPFLPWTIWVYFAFFPLIGWTALVVRPDLFLRFVLAATLAAVVAWACVLLFPISFERPDAASIAGEWHRRVFTFVHAVDPAHISFPSLHVAVTWICTFMLWQRRHRLSLLLLGAAISLSTLATRQHLVVDVAGGVALAWICVAAVTRLAATQGVRLADD